MLKYIYDAWGNHKVVDNNGNEITDTAHIGNINPYRYRGYYFDTETGLYYLKSRYYDPQTGRFISIDDISFADPDTINGLNLYAYCCNNPVMHIDPNGNDWNSFWNKVGNWFSNTFGSFLSLENTILKQQDDYFFVGRETGIIENIETSGATKPITFFAKSDSEKWKFWKYYVGVKININNFSTTFSFGVIDRLWSFKYENTSLDVQVGLNKIGAGVSTITNGLVGYSQIYIRTIPTAFLVLCAIFLPEALPALGGLVYGLQ